MRAIGHEVVTPDIVGIDGSPPDTRTVIEPQAFSFRLLGQHFEPFALPDPLDHPFVIHGPTLAVRYSAVLHRFAQFVDDLFRGKALAW